MRRFRVRLEELESRLAPASFAVNAQLQISRLDNLGDTPAGRRAIVFFESSVLNYQVLRQGLTADTDSVVLDSGGDGLREMAAFLAGRHELTSIGVVAHGAPGEVLLGTVALDEVILGSYRRELAVVSSALGHGGELDLWSCDVAAGQGGAFLVRDLAAATGVGVAAATHIIGAAASGGNWQLDVRAAGARGEVPFVHDALVGFDEFLGTWSAAASLPITRANHTATLLANGKVLVAGGEEFGSGGFPPKVASSALLYDPARNTWSNAASMATGRSGQTATLLSNGKVLTTGGYAVAFSSNPTLSSAELYDPVSNTWSSTASMATARCWQTATLLSSGKVLVTGGWDGTIALSSAELYDPPSNTWSTVDSMATPRARQTATLLNNGKVLVTGGWDGTNALSSAELYDPVSNTWSSAGSMTTARYFYTATLLNNGQVLVAGGEQNGTYLSSAELYDPASDTWTSAGSVGQARSFHTATLLSNGMVLVAGGDSQGFVSLSSAELYDPLSNTWSPTRSMAAPTGRGAHTATLLSNGKVLVAGGEDFHLNLSSAELYDPADWSHSTMTVTPATITLGGTATITVTVKDGLGNLVTTGGLTFRLVTLASPDGGAGTLSNLTDNHDGTYTATFTGTTPGPVTINATLNNQHIASSPTITTTSTTTTVISSSANPSIYGSISFTALVAAGGSPVTSGTVAFEEGSTILANNVTLDASGQANFSISTLSATASPHVITALYAGPSWLSASTASVSQTVSPRPITITADTQSKPLGAVDPPLTYHITAGSLVPGDSFTGALTRAAGDGTGSYVIEQGTLALNSNYVLTYVGANLTVTPAAQLVITNVGATSLTAGHTIAFTVTAQDSAGHTVPGYAGIVQLSSSDPNAMWSGASLPANYTFIVGDAGQHDFIVTLGTAGTQTITATDQANNSLSAASRAFSVAAGPFSKFVVNIQGGSSIAADNAFPFTVQAADQFGNPVTSYNGPASVTTTTSPVDPLGSFPITGTLNSSGFATFQGNLKTAGSYTLTSTASYLTGTSSSFTVALATVSTFAVTAPAAAITGSPFNVAVTALDQFGKIATGYSGQVHFTSSDPSAVLPADTTLAGGQGTFSVTLNTAGSQTITAIDSSPNSTITATSNVITARGLTVTSFAPTPTGFAVTFSKPFNPADLTLLGTGLHTVQDVILAGAASGPINGSLLIDPSNTSITFNATANGLLLLNNFESAALPDDTYTVTLVSGSVGNGFLDSLGVGLDGANSGGQASYTTTFTTHYQANGTPVLSIPDFARGPDGTHNIKVPSDTGHGILITLYNAAKVMDVLFTLNYNPTLLTVTGVANGDATDPASTFTRVGNAIFIDPTHATARFRYHDTTPQSGTVILGDIVAMVPNSAAGNYKAKELLQLTNFLINSGAITGAVGASGVHVNAYAGDVTGNGTIDALDVAFASNVARGTATGFPAYQLLDPAIIGDVATDFAVDAGDVSDLAAYTVRLPTPQIPAIPTGLTITPVGADPTLSLGESTDGGRIANPSHGGIFTVPVLIDNPHPEGSTGMTEAILALRYDPSVLSLSASDITLGSIPSLGEAWHLISAVDQVTGQIAITLYSTTPITATQAGSLVNIEFHAQAGERRGLSPAVATPVQLVSSVVLNGQEFATQVDDAQGQLVLSPGIDRVVMETDVGWPRRTASRSWIVRLSSRIG